MEDKTKYIPGARIWKTTIAVAIALFVGRVILKQTGFYTVIAALLSLKKDIKSTKQFSLYRIFGTILGGALGYLVVYILHDSNIAQDSIVYYLINIFSIFFILWMSKIFKTSENSSTMGCVVLLSITLSKFDEDIVTYVLYRVIETIIGVLIAWAINNFYQNRHLSENEMVNSEK